MVAQKLMRRNGNFEREKQQKTTMEGTEGTEGTEGGQSYGTMKREGKGGQPAA